MANMWLSICGHEDEENVPRPAQNVVILFHEEKRGDHTVESVCDAVEQLSYVPRSTRSPGEDILCQPKHQNVVDIHCYIRDYAGLHHS